MRECVCVCADDVACFEGLCLCARDPVGILGHTRQTLFTEVHPSPDPSSAANSHSAEHRGGAGCCLSPPPSLFGGSSLV